MLPLRSTKNHTTQVPISSVAGEKTDLWPCPPHLLFEVSNGQDPASPGAAVVEWWIVFNTLEFKQADLPPATSSGLRVGIDYEQVKLRFRSTNPVPVLVTFSG